MSDGRDRGDVLMLGISSGVIGGLTGGLLLGLGAALIASGQPAGWLAAFVGAPASALPGYVLARRYLASRAG